MRINGVDIRRFGAVQLTVEPHPPKIEISYEMLSKALLPTEYDTDIPLGSIDITIYFRATNRMKLERQMSAFMAQFKASCVIDEIKGFKGKYKGYLSSSSYEKTLVLHKKILDLSFDGYFYDESREMIFDGKLTGKAYAEGSRETPCILEVTAKETLTGYTTILNGEAYTIGSLEAGKTITIDGTAGKVLIDGENAFDTVDLWTFPRLLPGENSLQFSSDKAKVAVRYAPMWI